MDKIKKVENMKGITPVIAVILLLLITISLVGFAFVFLGRTTETAAESGEQQLEQQLQQFGAQFQIESVDKNQVYIRNTGTTALATLAFFVNNVLVAYSGPTSLATNAVGTYFLNDSQLAMLPDPARLRVTAAGASDELTADFYGRYDVGYWKFDETSGTAASDSSGNGNTGTLTNMESSDWVAGKYGNALSFDGVDELVEVDHDISLAPARITLTAWIYRTGGCPTSQDTCMIVNKEEDYEFGVRSGNTLQWAISTTTTPWFWHDTGIFIPQNEWTHVAITYDGSQVKSYKNGDLLDTRAYNGDIKNTGDCLRISRRSGCGGALHSPFNGLIDEVRILNIVRSMTTS